MNNLNAFEIVIECIGFENALKLIEAHGGLTFYIPKLSKSVYIATDIFKMKNNGYTKEQIKINLMQKYNLSHKNANKFINKFF